MHGYSTQVREYFIAQTRILLKVKESNINYYVGIKGVNKINRAVWHISQGSPAKQNQ